jgi:mannose-1-phosphate guanylyltransferase
VSTVNNVTGTIRLSSAFSPTGLQLDEQPGGWVHVVSTTPPHDVLAKIRHDRAGVLVEVFEGKGGTCLIVTDQRHKPGAGYRYFCLPGSQLALDEVSVEFLNPDAAAIPALTPSSGRLPTTPQAVTPQAMILGAGLGTRIEPLTGWTHRSKPALPVDGQHTVIGRLAMQLKAHGMAHLVVNTYCEPASVKASLAKVAGLSLHYIDEPAPSGTAGGLRRLFESPDDYPGYIDKTRPIVVAQGDAVADVDLSQLVQAHVANQAAITIGCQTVRDEDVSRFGIMMTDQRDPDGTSGQIVGFMEKPNLAEAGPHRLGSTGFYVLHPKVYDVLLDVYRTKQQQTGEAEPELDFAKDLFPAVLARIAAGSLHQDDGTPLCMWAQKLAGYWSDIGNPAQYYQTLCDVQAGALAWHEVEPLTCDHGCFHWVAESAVSNPQRQLAGAIIVTPLAGD